MCIIALKESGIDPIEERTLEQCWWNNGDGAGYAVWDIDRGEWKVRKGFMKFVTFLEAVKEENFTKDSFYLMHFRFATSGNKDGGNTHPFPLFKTVDKMRSHTFYTKYLAMHNGVCGAGRGVASDTMVCIEDYINPLWKIMVENKKYKELLYPILLEHIKATKNGSKWIITNNETAFQFGDWIVDDTGVNWSNDMYKPSVYTIRNPHKPATKVYPTYVSKRFDTTMNYMVVWDPLKSKDVPADEYQKEHPNVILTYYGNNYSRHNNSAYQTGFVDSSGMIVGADLIRTVDHSTAYITESGTIEWEDAKNEVFMNIMCPNCYDDSFLAESTFIDSDIICGNCGTVFNKDTGEIVTSDPEELEHLQKAGVV